MLWLAVLCLEWFFRLWSNWLTSLFRYGCFVFACLSVLRFDVSNRDTLALSRSLFISLLVSCCFSSSIFFIVSSNDELSILTYEENSGTTSSCKSSLSHCCYLSCGYWFMIGLIFGVLIYCNRLSLPIYWSLSLIVLKLWLSWEVSCLLEIDKWFIFSKRVSSRVSILSKRALTWVWNASKRVRTMERFDLRAFVGWVSGCGSIVLCWTPIRECDCECWRSLCWLNFISFWNY